MIFNAIHILGHLWKHYTQEASPEPVLFDFSEEERKLCDQVIKDLYAQFSNGQTKSCSLVFVQSVSWKNVTRLLDQHTYTGSQNWKKGFYDNIKALQDIGCDLQATYREIEYLCSNYPSDCKEIVDYVLENWDGLFLLQEDALIAFLTTQKVQAKVKASFEIAATPELKITSSYTSKPPLNYHGHRLDLVHDWDNLYECDIDTIANHAVEEVNQMLKK
jgi:hypothetical protein